MYMYKYMYMYMYMYKYMYMHVYLHPAAEINLQNLAQKAEPSMGISNNWQARRSLEWYTSYILIWLSSEAVINSWESGENVKDLMGMAWPERLMKKCEIAAEVVGGLLRRIHFNF